MKMPPKGRKSLTSWYVCEACSSVISHKDLEIHSRQSCPPDVPNWKHGFIKDRVIYSYLEETKVTDMAPTLNEKVKHGVVLLSQQAMQLCCIHIGEPVVLKYNHCSEIKIAWPTNEKSFTCVVITEEALNLYNGRPQMPVTVRKMKLLPLPMKEIHLQCKEEINSDKLPVLLSILKCNNIHKILCIGNQITVPFFGKQMTFSVKDVIHCEFNDDEILAQKIDDLNLEEHETRFFKWTLETKIVLCNEKTNKDEKEHALLTLDSIGGYKDIVKELKEIMSLALGLQKSPLNVPPSCGVLLYGPNGSGKTTIAHALVNTSKAYAVDIKTGELFSKFFGETEARLRSLFKQALERSPSIILIEDIDILCSKTGSSDQERRVVATLLSLIDLLQDKNVLVIATTSKLHMIDQALRRPGRLDCEIELTVPTPWDRLDILNILTSNFQLDSSVVKQIADMTHGYVAADLRALVSRACMNATTHNRNSILPSDLQWALGQVKPSAMREVTVQVPNVHWSDIGGQDDLKLKLRQAVEWPIRHPEAFSRLGISPPRGVLMFGPPGCSKTMIAKALATESKLNFLSIKGSELFSKWVGESERAVRELFKRARSVAPSIVFFDELDAMGGERTGVGSGGSNVQERVVAQLLTELDGVEALGDVIVVAATNRPDRIDKALLRPGRFDSLVYVPLPDLSSRQQILQLQFKKTPVADDVSVEELSEMMEGYSGAEVVAVCHEAALAALQENLNAAVVMKSHFLAALKIVTPRTPPSLLLSYQNYLQT